MSAHKLRRLGEAMAGFQAGGFGQPVLYQPLPAAGGDPVDRLGAIYNAMVERIDAQSRALERKDAACWAVLADVSHGLRTPLAAVRGYLETLLLREESFSPGERRRFLEIAARQAEGLGVLVAELFELARLDAREFLIDPEPVQLAELAQDIVHDFDLAARRQQTMLALDATPRVPFVLADMGLIERALRNLIENALQRSRAGGRVSLAVEARGGRVAVRVADTGASIPPQELPFVFDRLDRQVRSRTARAGGVGLGLAIVKRIVELHGARVEVRSAPHEGTTFSFALPATGT